ncbi:RHS repeat-associated core domain-containing protein [Myroides sp. TSA_177.3]|uniref:RHS repeat-associated core domain-containing protein n=1 Tax=Myroides sp. TSA_177.3 TaxID=3415650 RepID=UPI0040465D29
MSYSDANKNDKIDVGEIIEETNYYPFGLAHQGYNEKNNTIGDKYKYQYNGKELQDELGLNLYDYGARNYDAALGRWMNVDPHAERYTSWSLYSFVFNNPLVFIDPDGRDPIYTKNFWGRTKLIGDDGKDDGQSYLVSGVVKRDVKNSTKAGENYTGSLTESDNVFKIPTGGVMDDVISSVNDTKTSEKEHGGHANSGDANATRWDEGTPAQKVKDTSGNVIGAKASMNTFVVNGQRQMPLDASNVDYWWHTHPNTSVGGIQLGSSNPSPADFRFQTTMENRGFKGNTFVIGVRSGTVTFYNKNKSLITIKYSDFKTMGGK